LIINYETIYSGEVDWHRDCVVLFAVKEHKPKKEIMSINWIVLVLSLIAWILVEVGVVNEVTLIIIFLLLGLFFFFFMIG